VRAASVLLVPVSWLAISCGAPPRTGANAPATPAAAIVQHTSAAPVGADPASLHLGTQLPNRCLLGEDEAPRAANAAPGVPASSPGRAVRIEGWLHTSCTRLVDARGTAVRLLSINVGGMGPGTGAPTQHGPGHRSGWRIPDKVEYENIAAWGFNSVRLTISWSNLEPAPPVKRAGGTLIHHFNMPYVRALDGIVGEFRARGIAVILTMTQAYWSPAFKDIKTYFGHMPEGIGMPAWLYPDAARISVPKAEIEFFANERGMQDEFADAWRFVAKHYAHTPTVVGLDVLNEPVTHQSFHLQLLRLNELYARIGAAIRAVNPNALLIFQDNNDVSGHFSLTGPPPFPNVVYCYHMYAYDQATGDRITGDYLARARQWGVPLWNGEFPAFGASSPRPIDGHWKQDLTRYFDVARRENIGWDVFGYSSNWFLIEGTDRAKPELLSVVRQGF
jgi:hypothetical protein